MVNNSLVYLSVQFYEHENHGLLALPVFQKPFLSIPSPVWTTFAIHCSTHRFGCWPTSDWYPRSALRVSENVEVSITKAGNAQARRILIEAAWNNRSRTAANLILNRRRQKQPPQIVAIAIKAQHWLSRKFHRLWQRKHPHVAITAVTRELCGFVWTVLRETPPVQT